MICEWKRRNKMNTHCVYSVYVYTIQIQARMFYTSDCTYPATRKTAFEKDAFEDFLVINLSN